MSKSASTPNGDLLRKTVFVIYNRSDGSRWPPFLKKLFSHDYEHTVNINFLKDERLPHSSRQESSARYTPAVLVVVVTPEHLKFLKSNPNVGYRQALVNNQLDFSPDFSCMILLGVEEKDLKDLDKSGQPVERRFESYPRWSKFDYTSVDNITTITAGMFAKIESERLDKASIKGRIVYNTIKCNEEATVAISLEKELQTNSTIQAYLNFPGNPQNIPVKTQILNPYTVIFTTRERFEGEANVLVLINGSEVRLLPTSQIKFVSSANDVFTNSQIYIKFIDRILISGSIKDKKILAGVDEALAQMFASEEMMTMSSTAFEEFFGVLGDVATGSFLYPTILHLTAAYGFKELTSKLVDLPDAKLALKMSNSDNKLPEDLAREKGYSDLANFLESSRITELDDLYLNRMNMLNGFDTDDSQLMNQMRHNQTAGNDLYDDQIDQYIKPNIVRKKSSPAPPVPKKSSTTQTQAKTKVPPRVPSQEGPSEFYSQLENVMQRFMEGEINMAQTEQAFNKMKFNFQNGCETFKQKHEKTNKLREEMVRAKTNVIPEYDPSQQSFTTSRSFLIRKPSAITSGTLSSPPPLPLRSSKTLSRNY